MTLALPTGKQRTSILDATARLNIWSGSVRSGKTVGSTLAWLDFVRHGPPGALLMVGRTERTLKRNILDPIAELVGPSSYRLVAGSGEAIIFGRRVYLAGANDERSEGKIRGLTLAGAYGDELTLWPESFFTMLLSRLSVAGARFYGTTNPDAPAHWLKARYLDRADRLDLQHFRFGLYDNPTLDPAYLAALEAEYTGLWRRRYILGEWCLAEGVVYDQFDPDQHVVTELPEAFEQVRLGVDYGTANPTVFLLLGRSGTRWYVAREYYYDGRSSSRQKTDSDYASDMATFLGGLHPQSIEVDPSAASFIAQLRRSGIGPIHGADHAVLDGIRTVSRALASGQLLIHASCTHLIDELGLYSWDSKAQAKGEDKPLKTNDHAADALRYAAMRIFGRGDHTPVKKPKGS